MKVLVLTCSTGGGHNSCAKYIKEEFNDFNIDCDVKDYMEIIGPKASSIAEKLYLDSTKGKGGVFKSVYKLGELYNKTGITSPVYALNKLVKEKLYNYLKDNNYTLAIGTHVFPCLALSALKKEHNITFINVATDYECIPFWNETTPDVFVIPSKLLIPRFVEKGINEEILLPIGIPVASKTLKKKDENLLKHDKPSIVLTSGSMGFGEITETVKSILDNIDAYLVVVCGNNTKIKEELEKIDNENLIVKGFINNLVEYMKECDVVVAKPGGLTTTEIVMLRKPLVHMMPIPGVENYNASFFADNKMSLRANTVEEVVESIKEIINNKDLQKEMIENQKRLINDKSAYDLVQYVIENLDKENIYE